MAAAQYAQMGVMPNMLRNDLDMESFFDFSQGTQTNEQRAISRPTSKAGSSKQQPQFASPIYDDADERQVFAGPSHEYDRFRQQTGVPAGDLISLSHINPSFGGFNSGIDEMGFNNGFDDSWTTGIDMDANMNIDYASNLPTIVFPSDATVDPSSQNYIDPLSMDSTEEPPSNVGRLWPGMHQQQAQQAALAKARAQEHQQQQSRRQHELQQRQQQQQPQQQQQWPQQQHQLPQSKSAGKQRALSQHTDPWTEDSISRVLDGMRHNSHASVLSEEDGSVNNDFTPNFAHLKKDDEDLDEDERLLASEEGKKLTSKERRQLRNKVSARAFRSRRKEYIGQLEGELAVKAQECSTLKTENTALTEENARYRGLIQTLLRHPSFTPFLEDLSQDPTLLVSGESQSKRTRHKSAAKTPLPVRPSSTQPQDATSRRNSQQPPQIQAEQEMQPVAMTMFPDAPVDLSMLDLNNPGTYGINQIADYNLQQPQAFGAQSLSQGPSRLDLALDSVGKTNRDNEDYASFNAAAGW